MTMSNLQVRRATVEDLPKLIPLWEEEHLPCPDLEKRFKEFQVVESADGQLLGAIGLKVTGLEGWLHSEVFVHPEQGDVLRDLLWGRAQTLAQNHGLVRLWTQLDTPWWHRNGFQPPSAELLARLPADFCKAASPWLYVQLKEETAPAISIDKEFALFKESEKEATQRLYRQARVLKMIAFVLGVAVFVLVIVWAFFFMKTQGRLHK